MPIYEFYCQKCNTIFNFFSRSVNTEKIPDCPRCNDVKLSRRMSLFSVSGKAREDGDMEDLPFDESKMEKAMDYLARKADTINEDDPRQAAGLMRELTNMTGLKLGDGMEEALSRMEKGDDPDEVEAQMGDLLENEDPFKMPGKKADSSGKWRQPPNYDETLYDL